MLSIYEFSGGAYSGAYIEKASNSSNELGFCLDVSPLKIWEQGSNCAQQKDDTQKKLEKTLRISTKNRIFPSYHVHCFICKMNFIEFHHFSLAKNWFSFGLGPSANVATQLFCSRTIVTTSRSLRQNPLTTVRFDFLGGQVDRWTTKMLELKKKRNIRSFLEMVWGIK